MYKFSFKVKHKGCHETKFSKDFPKQHITVVDIQSTHPKEKQYFYYITGPNKEFDSVITYLKKSKAYKKVKEIERSKETLMLLVILYQKDYIQNIIQKYNGFFIELHTISGGYEYWHVGAVFREAIDKMLGHFKKMGELKVLYIGEVDFAHSLLSSQQKKVFDIAYEKGYYKSPRKTTIAKISKVLKLNSATVGEHLLKAENKIINQMAKKL